MGKQKNTIIVNGKVLDANTGTPIVHRHPKTLDGFIIPKATTKPSHLSTSITPKASPKRGGHSATDMHHRRQHSKTLVRSTVTKPNTPKLAALAARLETSGNSASSIVSAPIFHVEQRHKRANNIARSNLISRFSPNDPEPLLVTKTVSLRVKSRPKEHISGHNNTPIADSLETEPKTSVSEDIFTAALGRATSHQKPTLKKGRKHRVAKKLGISARAANIVVSVAIVVALGGFIAYQNVPNIAMHMAVAKAGVNAALPGYKPSGFAISRQIQATPGQVVINFHSNSDSRNFSITQTASDWNSQTLLDNYVALNDQQYQRLSQDNGKTIYIYGDTSATWVDGGIWYNITGKSSLSNDQLLKIANSF